MSVDENAMHNEAPQQTQQPQQPQQPPKKRAAWILPVGIGCGCLAVAVFLFICLLAALVGGPVAGGPRVALIYVDGIITAGSSGGLFSSDNGSAVKVVERLEKARKNKDIKAVVLRIDSPGGSPAGSEEIYNEIMRVRETKPVYVSMGDVAASGGYYVASAANRIFADASTVTGSIGVIMETVDLSGLFKKLGVDPQVVKSGKHKDIGTSNRPMTPEERQLIQAMIDDTYDQFIEAVSRGRKMSKTKVKEYATGRIFTGRQAKQIGLIDEIGGLHETINAAAKAGGLDGEPKVEEIGRSRGLSGLFGEKSDARRLSARDYEILTDMIIKRLTSEGIRLEGLR